MTRPRPRPLSVLAAFCSGCGKLLGATNPTRRRVEGRPGSVGACHETAAATTRMLQEGDIARIFQAGLHEFLEDFISRNNRLGSEIAEAYHFNT